MHTVLRKAAAAHRHLAELKGVASAIPNESILINMLVLQEAKDSSAVENIIMTHDDLFKAELFAEAGESQSAKEVQHYASALKKGFELVRQNKMLTLRYILTIQEELEQNQAGLRRSNLFRHPYTKIEFIMTDLRVSRLTSTRYVDLLTEKGFVAKHKMGRSNYYINQPLLTLFLKAEQGDSIPSSPTTQILSE